MDVETPVGLDHAATPTSSSGEELLHRLVHQAVSQVLKEAVHNGSLPALLKSLSLDSGSVRALASDPSPLPPAPASESARPATTTEARQPASRETAPAGLSPTAHPANEPAPSPREASDLLSRFEVSKRSDAEQGEAFHALERGTLRPVVVRMFRDHTGLEDGLVASMRLAASLLDRQRPVHLTKVVAVGLHHDHPFVATEAIHGRSLAELLPSRLPMSETEVLHLAEQVCHGLQGLHFATDSIHGDIRPETILVAYTGIAGGIDIGESESICLTDYLGPKPQWHRPETVPADACPDFVAPELAHGPSREAPSDIYSIGALMYLLLTGQRPQPMTDGTPAERLQKWMPPDPARLPMPMSEQARIILSTALAKDPEERYLTFHGMMVSCQRARRAVSEGETHSIRLLRKPMHPPRRTTEGRRDQRTPLPGSLPESPGKTASADDSALEPKLPGVDAGIAAAVSAEPFDATAVGTRIIRKFQERSVSGESQVPRGTATVRRSGIIRMPPSPETRVPTTTSLKRMPIPAPSTTKAEPIVSTAFGAGQGMQMPSLSGILVLLPVILIVALITCLVWVGIVSR